MKNYLYEVSDFNEVTKVVGYSNSIHVKVNTISNSVILCRGSVELSQQVEYPTLAEALEAAQAVLNVTSGLLVSLGERA